MSGVGFSQTFCLYNEIYRPDASMSYSTIQARPGEKTA